MKWTVKDSILYVIKWVKYFLINHKIRIFITFLSTIILTCIFNMQMSSNISAHLRSLEIIERVDYTLVGETNHSNYDGANFYQVFDEGYFYTERKSEFQFSHKINAISIKKLPNREYTASTSPIETLSLIEGELPQTPTQIALSMNTAKLYNLQLHDLIYYVSPKSPTVIFEVCGLLESYYGAYDIDPIANTGLLLLSQDASLTSNSYIQFLNKATSASYRDTYIKSHDVAALKAPISAATREALISSITSSIIIVILLNFSIRLYIRRFRQEGCTLFVKFLFIFLVCGIFFGGIFACNLLLQWASSLLNQVVIKTLLFELLLSLFITSLLLSIFWVRSTKLKEVSLSPKSK